MTKEENKYTITLQTEWVDMDKLVLTNHKGDTYTTKSEELMDFILSSESENERLIKEIEDRVVECILDDIDFGYDLATIKGKIKSGSYVGNSPETFKENERLKAEREWISTKDNPPKDGQDVLAYQVNPDWEGNILLRWNSASFTYIEYPYYMLEPQPPKQPPKKPICCEKYMRCQDCPSSPNYINPLTSNKQ